MPKREVLDQIYADAIKDSIGGTPVIEMPRNKVWVDTNERLWIDLKTVLDVLKEHLPKDQ